MWKEQIANNPLPGSTRSTKSQTTTPRSGPQRAMHKLGLVRPSGPLRVEETGSIVIPEHSVTCSNAGRDGAKVSSEDLDPINQARTG
ncbi:hypothetical protein [Candidatus Symbiobacter mobilis]|uniref:Uncharacterized protein n=1 Tax=Candidatus Symbiobacter mobilis CR TaxID=946483 RepID=U5NDA9_9BURK|nr:hypothetical protein [Candidatus Symbiobacter mobilis]AGX88228.1 hypothetical protein Cenrod_2159 [Candidatus Symbiobacter mobilis CR]